MIRTDAHRQTKGIICEVLDDRQNLNALDGRYAAGADNRRQGGYHGLGGGRLSSECDPQALAGLYFNFCPVEAGKLLRHAGCPKNGSIENAIVESTSCLREIIDDINVNSKFIDVLPGHPFANESKWLKTEKITSGSRFGGIFVPHV